MFNRNCLRFGGMENVLGLSASISSDLIHNILFNIYNLIMQGGSSYIDADAIIRAMEM